MRDLIWIGGVLAGERQRVELYGRDWPQVGRGLWFASSGAGALGGVRFGSILRQILHVDAKGNVSGRVKLDLPLYPLIGLGPLWLPSPVSSRSEMRPGDGLQFDFDDFEQSFCVGLSL